MSMLGLPLVMNYFLIASQSLNTSDPCTVSVNMSSNIHLINNQTQRQLLIPESILNSYKFNGILSFTSES